ncbi:hypothetical protein JCM18899A_32240 [Nocardioides sp. AN3]
MGKKKSQREIDSLTAELGKAQAKADRWKAKAQRWKAEARESQRRLDKLRTRFEKALGASADRAAPGGSPPAVEVGELAETTGVAVAPATELGRLEQTIAEAATGEAPGPGSHATPDATWTLTALQVAAEERGIVDYSRHTRDELLRLLAE